MENYFQETKLKDFEFRFLFSSSYMKTSFLDLKNLKIWTE